ncbi:MAG: adenylosuccinate synthase [Cytophagales bacterium]|nr:adenylosuccinate synthase [Cytophagales bacterium]MDW8384594.1 adenylosuccinate synthase [Flammeovirgaceae bacterium]
MDILLGLQWGDEGKGKIVDVLAPRYDVVARFQGGPNAGHTLEFEGKKLVLHQVPSGILHPQIANIIGNGVVLDPIIFRKEIQNIIPFGVDIHANLFISKKAHLILPAHRLLDAVSEASKGDKKIGSTLKGIGPTYRDKIGRSGLRVGDTLLSDFKMRYQQISEWHDILFKGYGVSKDELSKQFKKNERENYENFDELESDFWEGIEFLKTLNLIDSEYKVNELILKGKKLLAEGAQGTLLDVDFGSYPFVTSSNTFAAGACTGLGVAPRYVREVFGIFKAYCTRVGGGPFPTELRDETGDNIRKIGNEFGSTTGRPRRTGWLDLPALRYAIMLNGVTHLFMMKADVFNTFDEIKVCTHYRLPDGSLVDSFPYDLCDIKLEPVYVTFKGWKTNISKVKEYHLLPDLFKKYVEFIEKQTGVPITIISLSPDRKDTIFRKPHW